MKILLFGKNGQVGWELQRSLATLGEMIALDCDSKAFCGDFTDLEGIAETVRSIAPDIIVNAAAYTAVDKAESEPELCRIINASAPTVLAQEAKRSGAWLVHYSTDYVFDGSGDQPWIETDRANPLSVYGRTKFEGEELIRASGCHQLILRTSWVYAARGGNFAKTMLRLAQERESLNVINDQTGGPTGAELLADATAHAIRVVLQRPELGGLYHLAASGETSWHGYAQFIIDFARQAGMEVKVAVDKIHAVPSNVFPLPAIRPKNSRLDTSKFQNAFGINLPNWQSGVTRLLNEMIDQSS